MHAGEKILVRVTAAREGQPAAVGVVAEFWPPGQDPVNDPAARARPYHRVPCEFDDRSRRWVARADTAGWPPGIWWVRGLVAEEDGEVWGWSSFPLAA